MLTVYKGHNKLNFLVDHFKESNNSKLLVCHVKRMWQFKITDLIVTSAWPVQQFESASSLIHHSMLVCVCATQVHNKNCKIHKSTLVQVQSCKNNIMLNIETNNLH